jgi:hypothetical protein
LGPKSGDFGYYGLGTGWEDGSVEPDACRGLAVKLGSDGSACSGMYTRGDNELRGQVVEHGGADGERGGRGTSELGLDVGGDCDDVTGYEITDGHDYAELAGGELDDGTGPTGADHGVLDATIDPTILAKNCDHGHIKGSLRLIGLV